MLVDRLLSIVLFVLVMVGTPGPNNLMLMASGVNFGLRRSLRHIGGIAFGCQMLLLAAAAGLGQLLMLVPQTMELLRWIAVLFVFYMAWLLFAARGDTPPHRQGSQPLGFWQAVLFQWVNPKAWLICMALIATHTDPARPLSTTAWASLVFFLVGTPLLVGWVIGGRIMQTWLHRGERLVWFNRFMGLLLMVSILPVLA